ncbi:hypothetical protein KY290_017382 [Solanum tuberosum]|uniref:RNase H type-1 domain-containing protein n=1 Tax=Solanum tuberosum TaxID=4113 RepID=A0ABQ7VB47_SOLTU|nr:hypothetical protein KY290_017382 [Solanum tuberosum]
MAESLAAEFGVTWCCHHGYTDLILEIDSIIIAKMLNNNSGTNLKLKQVIDSINIIKNRVGFQVSHCFREGNQLADYLAKMASFSAQSLLTQAFAQLPRQAKGFFLLDKWKLPSFRCKYDEANFFVS